MLPRVLEPEVMDSEEEACDYDTMDHGAVNSTFCNDLLAVWKDKPSPARLIDLGTGTALIPIQWCALHEKDEWVAVDLAEHMVARARENVAAANLSGRIALVRGDAKTLRRPERFDAVVSNSIVHHIADSTNTFANMCELLAPRGVLFVRDLLRPNDLAELESLVSQYAPVLGEGELREQSLRQQALFRASLHAALTLAEVSALAKTVSIPSEAVVQTSDRHWTLAWQRA